MQQHLFSLPERRVELDSSVQWLGVRDYLQEAEVVAGMVQQAMQDDPSLRFADMAMLVKGEPFPCTTIHVHGKDPLELEQRESGCKAPVFGRSCIEPGNIDDYALTPEYVVEDLAEIWDYIAEDSPNRADSFIDSIDSKFRELSELPHIGRPRHG
ncbi:type II toxin-antitoxin system RelE/ParE family toxin [Prosthecochloris vibrioformis]|uniref:type II toxin-antitoxin system RelE/ParE family toxin n=1 Tax=Prosthecochloris vibrioformis TaxID=1098 RepID=UPI001F1B6E73|nr:type II toxin-antitoxin system RelE/ParE family toxin [Prosthecochloris vibrioformis]